MRPDELQAALDRIRGPYTDEDKADLLEALKREAAGQRLTRGGSWTDEEMGLRPGAYSSKAGFLTESVEDTKMWGDQAHINFTGPEPATAIPTAQLVHVSRKRPATFQTLVTVNFGNGWTGEGLWTVAIAYLVGVGQAKTALVIPIPIAAPTSNSQVFDARQLPVTALQIAVTLFGTSVVAAPHDVLVTALVAPVTP